MGAAAEWLFKTGDAKLISAVLFHKRQRLTGFIIEDLLKRLGGLASVEDWFDFQQGLVAPLYRAEEGEVGATRALRAAPDDFDRRVDQLACGRSVRQLRAVGDAFAWLVLENQRSAIVALAQNKPSGRIYGKDGFDAELQVVQGYWDQTGHFALIHDLTNCLRIHDLTVVNRFHRAGAPEHPCGKNAYDVVEVKARPGRRPHQRQEKRLTDAMEAINKGGRLIGPDGVFEQFRPTVTLHSHLDALAGLLDGVMRDEAGANSITVEDGWVASAFRLAGHPAGTNVLDVLKEVERRRDAAMKSAGFSDGAEIFRLQTGDGAGRALFRLPYGLYPIPPRTASFLTCDWLIYESILSPGRLEDALKREGVSVERKSGPILRITRGDHSIEVTRRSIEPALHEMITVDTMAAALAEWVGQPGFIGQGQLIFPTATVPQSAIFAMQTRASGTERPPQG